MEFRDPNGLRCKFSPWDFLNFNISASGVAGKGSPIEAGMRQGYCWYLSVSLLVVAFDVPAVAIMMIVCDKPDAKVSHTPRVGANTSDAISALELHVEWRCHAVQAPAIFFAVLFFSFDKELGVAQMGCSEQTGYACVCLLLGLDFSQTNSATHQLVAVGRGEEGGVCRVNRQAPGGI